MQEFFSALSYDQFKIHFHSSSKGLLGGKFNRPGYDQSTIMTVITVILWHSCTIFLHV